MPKLKREPLPWHQIGTTWLARHAELDHGDVIRATAAFAEDQEIAPNTLRRYHSAAAFLEQLRRRGDIDDAQLAELAGQKIKCVGVLQRIAHHGREHVNPMLRLMLGEPTPTRKELEDEERRIRNDGARDAARQACQDPAANAHSFRLRASAFRRAAIEAWTQEAVAAAQEAVAPWPALREVVPLTIHAGAIGPSGAHALRVVATTSEGTRMRPRAEEAFEARIGGLFVEALAAARIFRTVTLLAQSREDAATLAAAAGRFPGSGVGVAVIGPGGSVEFLTKPGRNIPPDLTPDFAALLQVSRK